MISLIARMPIAKDSPPRTNIRYCLGWSAAAAAAVEAAAVEAAAAAEPAEAAVAPAGAEAALAAARSVWRCAIFKFSLRLWPLENFANYDSLGSVAIDPARSAATSLILRVTFGAIELRRAACLTVLPAPATLKNDMVCWSCSA